MTKPSRTIGFFLFFSFGLPSLLQAGGSWLNDTLSNSGTAARWVCPSGNCPTGGKWQMYWKSDPGHLTKGKRVITSIRGVEDWVKPMFEAWQKVKLPYKMGEDPVATVALEIIYDGPLENFEDIDVTNYSQFAFDIPPHQLPTVVIFDPDGEIIADYCFKGCKVRGESDANCNLECYGDPTATSCEAINGKTMGARNCIAGLAQPFTDSTDKLIKRGFIILNGRLINGIDPATDPTDNEASDDQFKGVITHEIGHLLNLDHSQINWEITENCSSDDCDGAIGIGTMFPTLKTTAQYTLHVDDKVTISWLYPTQAFKDNFCVIAGEVQNQDGKGMQGVNVIARSINDPLVDVRSMVSGVLYAPGSDNGQYFLSGIIPGVEYEVLYEELLAQYNEREGSGFGPLEAASPTGFGNGVIAGPKGAATVHCNGGEEVIEMEPLKISLAEGRATSGAVSGEGGGGEPIQKKGWCLLINTKNQIANSKYFMFGIFSFILILFIFRLHFKGAR